MRLEFLPFVLQFQRHRISGDQPPWRPVDLQAANERKKFLVEKTPLRLGMAPLVAHAEEPAAARLRKRRCPAILNLRRFLHSEPQPRPQAPTTNLKFRKKIQLPAGVSGRPRKQLEVPDFAVVGACAVVYPQGSAFVDLRLRQLISMSVGRSKTA